ncbi:DUF2937 family protein [Microvirga lotononidis]|uniref:DUF2937 domain-containing protein n=1 Tax=Microvirga lotononidis TaxID=864069 RepID=I4YTJ8_9HYPH|nr:DUF2937 family protein [Microvirga lotononidis]EIM27290.1 Protein of unknown function (DUF2937) [Microvirga lotononidis]WQO28537.1 DUF2937 family protein [Microvirga lotononidis]
MSRIVRIVAFGLGLCGGVVASQGPEFAQQYRQRLGGTIDELQRVITRFDADAQASGETLESAITRLRSNADDFVSRQGAAMQANVERLSRLEAHRGAMMQAGPFSRIALMVRDGDQDVMEAVYRDFEPALPVTEEGILSSAAGFVALWGGMLLLAGFIRSLWRRPRHTARA